MWKGSYRPTICLFFVFVWGIKSARASNIFRDMFHHSPVFCCFNFFGPCSLDFTPMSRRTRTRTILFRSPTVTGFFNATSARLAPARFRAVPRASARFIGSAPDRSGSLRIARSFAETQKCDRDPGLQKVSNQVCFRRRTRRRSAVWSESGECRLWVFACAVFRKPERMRFRMREVMLEPESLTWDVGALDCWKKTWRDDEECRCVSKDYLIR